MPYQIYPTPPTGYQLNAEQGFFSVIVAEETENLITNPSVELSTTGFFDLAVGTIERSEEERVFGAFSLKYTPNSNPTAGVYYTLDVISDTMHTGSVYVKCRNSIPYRFYIYNNNFSYVISELKFFGTGEWQRLIVTGESGAGGSGITELWVVVRKDNHDSTDPIYLDGWQLERKGYATTYADGDMVGLIPGQKAFYWTGTRHASTSMRTFETNAGGRIKRLDESGFKLIGMVGLGMPPVSNITSPLALTGGSSYQRTVPNQRPFTLIGDLTGATLRQLQVQRNMLINMLKPTTLVPQPIMLRYQLYKCLDPIGQELEIPCVYSAGLEGNTDNNHHERLSIQLLAMTPYIRRVMDSSQVSLDAIVNNPDCDFMCQRYFDLEGPLKTAWQSVAKGTDGIVRASLWGPDGKLYVVGDFLNAIDIGGPVPVNYIARYDPLLDTWSALSTGADDIVRCLAFDSTGRLYVGGDFTNIGGGPAVVANHIAYWDGLAWNAMGATPGVSGGDVYTIAIDAYNNVYVGGDFTSAGGAAADRVAYWDGTNWSTLVPAGTGPNLRVRSIQIDLESDDVYIVGEFGTFAGLTVDRTAKYVPLTDTVFPLGSGLNNAALCSLLLNGKLYVGGSFTQAGGNDVGAAPTGGLVAVWDGATWAPLAGGLGGGVANVFQIGYDPKYGELFFVGAFEDYYQSMNLASKVSPLNSFVGWNGVAWFQPDVDLPGSITITYSVSSRLDGRMIVGYDIAGNAITTNLLILTNEGSADAYPRIFMYGQGSVYQLINYTTGESIFFDNVTVLEGEIIILDLTPGQKTLTSNIRGNLLNRVAPGSDLATWRLKPGDNVVSVHLPNAFAEISVFWKDSEWSIDGAV